MCLDEAVINPHIAELLVLGDTDDPAVAARLAKQRMMTRDEGPIEEVLVQRKGHPNQRIVFVGKERGGCGS